MSLYCKHKYKVVSEHNTGHWSDAVDDYVALCSCEKCGKTKYVNSKASGFKWVVTLITLALGATVIIALLFKL